MMAKAEMVKCLQFGGEIFRVDDIVEIKDSTINKETIVGRISGFEKVDNHCPPNMGVIIDTSTLFNRESRLIDLELIRSVKKLKK